MRNNKKVVKIAKYFYNFFIGPTQTCSNYKLDLLLVQLMFPSYPVKQEMAGRRKP